MLVDSTPSPSSEAIALCVSIDYDIQSIRKPLHVKMDESLHNSEACSAGVQCLVEYPISIVLCAHLVYFT